MNKNTVISATDNTMRKLKALAGKKRSVKTKMAVSAKKLGQKARKVAVMADKGSNIYKNKKTVTSATRNTILRLRVSAKKKEKVRGKLAVTAKEKEVVRNKLVTTAKQLATTAKEKEDVRNKLVITAKELAVTAKKTELMNIELRSLDVAKDEFVSIASHQLRTPLTALKGYTGMLLDGDAGPINDKQREYLVEIKNSNDRMIGLITALLNVSRVDLGVFIVEPELLSLKKVAEEALKDLSLKVEGKQLQIETNFRDDVPLINADLSIVRMIFQNLFSNAVKYTSAKGKIIVNIKKDGSNALISVADTGYGIPSKVQSKIFTKMFRADNARVKDPEGTGLGLYIIKSTIEKTGGKIWFESVENKGSIFYVTIPLAGMKKKEGTKRLELK